MQVPSVLARQLTLSRRFEISMDAMRSNMFPHTRVSCPSHPGRTAGGFDPRWQGRLRHVARKPQVRRTHPSPDQQGRCLRMRRGDGGARDEFQSNDQNRATASDRPGARPA